MNGKNVLFTNTAMFEMTMTTIFFQKKLKKKFDMRMRKDENIDDMAKCFFLHTNNHLKICAYRYICIRFEAVFFLEYFSQKLFE